MGLIPEALYGEALKGHPMIHGCRRRPHGARPSGKTKGRRAQSGPPLSRWIKTGRKELGAALPDRCMESGKLLGGEKGDAKVFLEKGDEKKEMRVEKLLEKTDQDFGSRTRSPKLPNISPKKRMEDQSVNEDAADECTTEMTSMS